MSLPLLKLPILPPALGQMLTQVWLVFPPPLSAPNRIVFWEGSLKPTVNPSAPTFCDQFVQHLGLPRVWFLTITLPCFSLFFLASFFLSFFFFLLASIEMLDKILSPLVCWPCVFWCNYEFACFFLPLPSFSNHFLDFKSPHHPCFQLKIP